MKVLPLVLSVLAVSALGAWTPAEAKDNHLRRTYDANKRWQAATKGSSYNHLRETYDRNKRIQAWQRGGSYNHLREVYDRNRALGYGYNNRMGNINNRQAQLLNQITNGVGNGTLTVEEAARLRARVTQLDALEMRLAQGGLSGQEYARLNTSLIQLRQQIIAEMNDGQHRWY